MTDLLPLYLRREPAAERGRSDIVGYRNEAATIRAGLWPWYYSKSKPRFGAKRVTFNCYTWRVVWLPDLPRQ